MSAVVDEVSRGLRDEDALAQAGRRAGAGDERRGPWRRQPRRESRRCHPVTLPALRLRTGAAPP